MALPFRSETLELLDRAQRAIDTSIRVRRERHAILEQMRMWHAAMELRLGQARAFDSSRHAAITYLNAETPIRAMVAHDRFDIHRGQSCARGEPQGAQRGPCASPRSERTTYPTALPVPKQRWTGRRRSRNEKTGSHTESGPPREIRAARPRNHPARRRF